MPESTLKKFHEAWAYWLALVVCFIPSVLGLYFENKMLAYAGNAAQAENRINLESLPEVQIARGLVSDAEKHLATLKADTGGVRFAKLQIPGISLTIQKLDTSSQWQNRRKADTERGRRSFYERQVEEHSGKINAANQAVERERTSLRAVLAKALEKYGDKSWSEVAGEKTGFDVVGVFSGALTMGLGIVLNMLRIILVLLYPRIQEDKKEPVVQIVAQPEVKKEPEQKWGPEFLRKYAREDMFLKCVAKGAKSFADIQTFSKSQGLEINKETARLTIWEKKLLNAVPELQEYIEDWEQKHKMKLKDFRNRNGAYHEA
jgi:hypothetical protein